ncbi:sensor histidine kinase [Dactylosporangium sp. NPDC049742]|uniref:sensor histidine kinase n=1 Tax=Dactylosporangium sp. NPDC049742 TaxID=3154737 RepID=UPI00341355BB
MTSVPFELPETSESRLRLQRLLVPLPYILLGVSAVLGLLSPGQSARDRLVTLALVAVTAAWALGMYTLRPPSWTRRTGPMLLYVGGQLALAAVLMSWQPAFFVFATVGFVQAYEVLPPRWAFVSIFLTSCLVNVLPGGVPDTPEWATMVVLIVALQTFLIGWFGYLGYRFSDETEQRHRAVAQLRTALAENAGLHAQLLEQAREAGIHHERQRMAREIHDTLAQGLTGIITQLQAAERVRDDPRLWRHHVDQVHTLARESLAAARRSVAALGPQELEDVRLPEALADLAARWSRTSGVPVQLETTGEARTLHTEIEVTLFRAAQEALANVAKHAGAARVAVTLSYLDDVVMLDVRDDGAGFDPAAVPPGGGADGSGFGLHGVRQRAERVQGTLTIESEPGDGTTLNVTVPALTPETRPS